MIRKIAVALLVILIALQFVRPARNLGPADTATDITHYTHVPDTVIHMLKTSCYDCHSNHTEYPWYVNFNPVGLWLRDHINEGKRAINFSDLSVLSKQKLRHRMGDISEQVTSGEMPLGSYTFIHRYAKLDSGQIRLIKDWAETAKKEF